MPLDTQTFALSRWWAHAGLLAVQKNEAIFTKAHLRTARRELIAGKNQVLAIKNWLSAAQMIEKSGSSYKLSRAGLCIVQNDKDLRKSSTWWIFHLLTAFGDDPFPYDAIFLTLDANVRQYISTSSLHKSIFKIGEGRAESSIDTYMDGITKMFRDDGPLQGLGLIDLKRGKQADSQVMSEVYWRLGSPHVPDGAILLGLALARRKYFLTRPSIDFSELLKRGLAQYLTLSQDDLRKRLGEIAHSAAWSDDVKFDDVANLTSISFGKKFNDDRMLIALLQEGGDSWM